MAAGDAYVVLSVAVANNAFVDLAPSSGQEISIHTIYYEGAVELYWYDGTNQILFDSDAGGGVRRNLTHKCTSSIRVRVKNKSGGAQNIGADGMYTK